MSRIAIVTMIHHDNFGNRLQNFALQEVLKGMGHAVVTIRNTPRLGDGNPVRRKAEVLRRSGLRAFRYKFENVLEKIQSRHSTGSVLGDGAQAPIISGNSAFTKRCISESDFTFESLPDPRCLADEFDYFVVGSDQVWNPEFRLLNGIDFLTFVRPEQRVAYAASIGTDTLSPYVSRRYKRFMQDIPSISVREESAARLVRELTGRAVPVVLDPTMLLDKTIWASLSDAAESRPRPGYVAKFYIGSVPSGSDALVSEFARRKGLRVESSGVGGDVDRPLNSPSEFLALIKNASLVVTNSYHAAVFATIFRTPYLVKGRGAMNSRFETLEEKTGISAMRWYAEGNFDAALRIEWREVARRLDRERAHSIAYLEGALKRAFPSEVTS